MDNNTNLQKYQVSAVQLSDYELITITDTQVKNVICYFNTTTYGYDETVKLAEEIANYLNIQ